MNTTPLPITIARAIANAAEHYMGQRDAFDIANNLGGCDREDLLDVKVIRESIERRVDVCGLKCSNVAACAEDIVRAVHRCAAIAEEARLLIKQGTHPDVAHSHAQAIQEARS